MAAKLIAQDEAHFGQELLLQDAGEWIIGGDPATCNILLPGYAPSQKFLCRPTPKGFQIETLSGSDPIVVNDKTINTYAFLDNGDQVRLGDRLWRFSLMNEAPPAVGALVTSFNNNQKKNIEMNMDQASKRQESEPKEKEESHDEGSHDEEARNELSDWEEEESGETPLEDNTTWGEGDDEEEESLAPSKSEEESEEQSELSAEPSVELENSSEESLEPSSESKEQSKNDEEISQDPPKEEEKEFVYDDELSPGEPPSFEQMDLELTETGRWLLKVVSGPNNGAEFSLQTGNTYLIGTDPNICDVVFHDNSVSRQHARLVVNNEDVLTVEDLNSRNGTMVDAQPLTKRSVLEPNILVTLGSTSFVVIDREGQMQTIISPFLPSIVKLLQDKQAVEEKSRQEEEKGAATTISEQAQEAEKSSAAVTAAEAPREQHMGMILLTAIVIGVGAVAVTAITSLFSPGTSVVVEKHDATESIEKVMHDYPSVRYSFNKNTGKLLLVGHVLTSVDRHQLFYELESIPEIESLDDKVIVDEYVWQEANQIVARTPVWRGINVHASAPGKFVLSGYLQTHEQSERLYDYISSNFPYLDLLDKQVVIEEDVVSAVSSALRKHGFIDMKVQMQEGELTLTGGVPQARRTEFQALMADFAKIPGVRDVKNMAFNLAPEQSTIDVTDRYEVTGFSKAGDKLSVVIGKRALYEGDTLDGMRIERITPTTVLLDKDGVKYRINYSA